MPETVSLECGGSDGRIAGGVIVARGFMERKAAATLLLRSIHGGVGMFEELVDAMVVVGIYRDSDTDSDGDRVPLERKDRRDGLSNPLRDNHDTLLGRDTFQNNGKLVPTHACDGIDLAYASLQSLRNGFEKLIADIMAERIVHRLEAV